MTARTSSLRQVNDLTDLKHLGDDPGVRLQQSLDRFCVSLLGQLPKRVAGLDRVRVLVVAAIFVTGIFVVVLFFFVIVLFDLLAVRFQRFREVVFEGKGNGNAGSGKRWLLPLPRAVPTFLLTFFFL